MKLKIDFDTPEEQKIYEEDPRFQEFAEAEVKNLFISRANQKVAVKTQKAQDFLIDPRTKDVMEAAILQSEIIVNG